MASFDQTEHMQYSKEETQWPVQLIVLKVIRTQIDNIKSQLKKTLNQPAKETVAFLLCVKCKLTQKTKSSSNGNSKVQILTL